jgi:hypothetical protein
MEVRIEIPFPKLLLGKGDKTQNATKKPEKTKTKTPPPFILMLILRTYFSR